MREGSGLSGGISESNMEDKMQNYINKLYKIKIFHISHVVFYNNSILTV